MLFDSRIYRRKRAVMQPSLSPRLTPRIVVDQTVALYDAPISIALEGFEPKNPRDRDRDLRALHWRRLAPRQLGGGGRCVAPCLGLP